MASSISGRAGIAIEPKKHAERKRPTIMIDKLSVIPRISDGPTKIKKRPRKKALVIRVNRF